MKRLIKISSDVFGVLQHLKTLNENFELYFNPTISKFLLYEKTLLSSVYFCACPFAKLDRRFVWHVQKLLKKSSQDVVLEIEKSNKLIEEKKQQKVLDETTYKVSEIVKFGQSSSKSYLFEDSFDNDWL